MHRVAYVAITILTNNMTTVLAFDTVDNFLVLVVLTLGARYINVK